MNPFEKFGIDHLSPSSLNNYAANPALWVGKYLLGWKEDFGPAATRGHAVEAGLDSWLYERDSLKAAEIALGQFAEKTAGQADDEHELERANIAPMLSQAINALSGFPKPLSRQIKVEHYVNGIEIPIVGYVDYHFEECGLDLKTTKACPSSIKADNGRQCALYSVAKNKPWKVLYVTAKKFALYDLAQEDAELHMRDLERAARSVRHLLNKSEDAKDAFRFFAPDPDNFRWSPGTIALAREAA
jgi:hypothetical protein